MQVKTKQKITAFGKEKSGTAALSSNDTELQLKLRWYLELFSIKNFVIFEILNGLLE